MDFDPKEMTASRIAADIRAGRKSAEAVLEYFIDRNERENGVINAIVTFDREGAMRRARQADAALARGEIWGPLHGVPVTFKDSFETAGIRTACGAAFLGDHLPVRDATVVSRCLEAGAVLLGKTNVPPMLDGLDTENAVFGATRNPWNPKHSAGGSSGGSAAAIAAGLSPLDIASDMGGSIRIPAHFCGTFGLKTSQGRVSRAGHLPPVGDGSRYLDTVLGTAGPMARSVDDLMLAFGVLAGAADPRHPETVPVPVAGPPPAAAARAGGIRIGWCDVFGDLDVSRETRQALERFVETLAREGIAVRKGAPPRFDFNKAWHAVGVVFGFTVAAGMSENVRAEWAEALPMLAGDRSSPFAAGVLKGARLDIAGYARAMDDRLELISAFEAFVSDTGEVDAFLCPAACVTAPPQGFAGETVHVDGKPVPIAMALVAYAAIFNLTGHPVVSLPVARSPLSGLPIGFQLVGKRWREMELLQTAKHLYPGTAPLAATEAVTPS